MPDLKLDAATQDDVDLCNLVDPPTRGVRFGSGIHVDIPDNWSERCLAGERVPGCTGHYIDADGTLTIAHELQERLDDPDVIGKVDPSDLLAFEQKLKTATEFPVLVLVEPEAIEEVKLQ